jgi:hypothetical protein
MKTQLASTALNLAGRRRYCILVCAIFLLTSLAAWAQNHDGIAVLNGGRTTILLKAPAAQKTPAQLPTAGLTTIYSNLGTGSNVYNAAAGTGILGKNTGMLFPEWLADGFTPTADHTITEIQVGVTWVQGPNTVILSVNTDNNGKPDVALHTWVMFSNLPTFGSCCVLQTAKVPGGIAVKKNTQYWLVLRTFNNNDGTWDVWNDNFNEVNGPFSNNLGTGWLLGGIQAQGAFGIFGQ